MNSSYYFKRSSALPTAAPQVVNPDPGPSSPVTTPDSDPPPASSFVSSLLPAGCDPLPDLFSGLVFGFHGVSAEERERLERFILAYDGETRGDTESPKITHLVCKKVKVTIL